MTSHPTTGAQQATDTAQTGVAPALLVVDDEPQLVNLIAYAARTEGYVVHTASTGADALHLLDEHPIDLVVIDVLLPDIDGHELCRRIRLHRQVPIIFLTVRADQSEVIAGLEAGGDDYLGKPFSVEELLLRINAVLRRVGEAPRLLGVGRLTLDLDQHEASVDDEALDLTPLEFRFLRYLAANHERVVGVPELVREVWELVPVDAHDAIVKSVVYRLRQKLDAASATAVELRNVRGIGYQLRPAGPG